MNFGAGRRLFHAMASAASGSIGFTVRGPIERVELPGLSERVCAILAANAGSTLDCDVTNVPADAVTVEALARLQLVAHRNGCTVRLRNATAALLDLVTLMGLDDVFGGAVTPRDAAAD